jgi:hypothetical protein
MALDRRSTLVSPHVNVRLVLNEALHADWKVDWVCCAFHAFDGTEYDVQFVKDNVGNCAQMYKAQYEKCQKTEKEEDKKETQA